MQEALAPARGRRPTTRRAAGAAVLALAPFVAWAGRSADGNAKDTRATPWAVSLVDVARELGLDRPSTYGVDRKRFIIETNGAGVALFDADGDGWLDALVLGGARLEERGREDAPLPNEMLPTSRLYRNLGGKRFKDETARSGLDRHGWASSVCAGDYDADGRLDLFVTYFGRNALFRNLGAGRFADATAASGLAAHRERWGSGCTFLDYDRDGDLDLFVSNYLVFERATVRAPGEGPNCFWKGLPVACGPKGLPHETHLLYRNEGNGRFTDVSGVSGIGAVTRRYAMTAVAADLDGDGWVDIYVACDSTAAILFRNNRDGTFTDVAVESGAAYSEYGMEQAGMGVGIGDFDSDGRIDLVKTHFADDIPALYRNLGNGLFQDVAAAAGLGVRNQHVEWGVGMPDLDNDGWQDLLYVTGNVYPEIEQHFARYPHKGPRVIFRNMGGGRFEDFSESSGSSPLSPHSSRGAAFGDVDNDGDVDVLIMNMNEPPSLLRNGYSGGNAWLEIALEGRPSNRFGLGATVVLEAQGRRQARVVLSQSSYGSHDDLRLHFGLGAAESADEVEVRWPSGHVDLLRAVKGRRVLTIREGDHPDRRGARSG